MATKLNKDFYFTDKEIADWHDQWSKEKFGNECLEPSRYYNTTDDGRYLYGVKVDNDLNDEKAIREKVLDLAIKIRNINRKLKGGGLSIHLNYDERKKIEMERNDLYDEFYKLAYNEQMEQYKISKSTRGRGRPKETFKDKIINDADGEKLQKLHLMIDGNKGKDVALIILAGIKIGWLTRPTYTQVRKEFGEIGSQQGFTNYLNESKFNQNEIDGAINNLKN